MHLNDNIAKCLGKKLIKGQKFGVELEYENWNGEWALVSYWSHHGDNSLRNNGVEFVSTPLSEKEIDPAMVELQALFTTTNVRVHDRCGTHIHLNMLPYTWKDLWNLSVVYTLLEPSIFESYAPGRKDSHFCVPSFHNNQLGRALLKDNVILRTGRPFGGERIEEAVPDDDPARIRRGDLEAVLLGRRLQAPIRPPDGFARRPRQDQPERVRLRMFETSKYSAMNFTSLQNLGTVEMRQLGSTQDIRRLTNWVRFLGQLQQYSLSFGDPLDVLTRYEQVGLAQMSREAGLQPQRVTPDEQVRAEKIATFMAGYVPPNWEDLDWNIARTA